FGLQVVWQIGVDPTTDLLIGCETDADRTMYRIRVLQQVPGNGHHDGDACLVISPEQGGPAGGDDIFTNFPGQVGRLFRREHQAWVVGKANVTTIIMTMDDWLHTVSAEGRSRIHMGQKRDGGNRGLNGTWDSR